MNPNTNRRNPRRKHTGQVPLESLVGKQEAHREQKSKDRQAFLDGARTIAENQIALAVRTKKLVRIDFTSNETKDDKFRKEVHRQLLRMIERSNLSIEVGPPDWLQRGFFLLSPARYSEAQLKERMEKINNFFRKGFDYAQITKANSYPVPLEDLRDEVAKCSDYEVSEIAEGAFAVRRKPTPCSDAESRTKEPSRTSKEKTT